DFAALHGQFVAAGCEVLGVSRDSLKAHENFRAKNALPFALLSDREEAACTAYDVIKLKKLYGKEVRGIERSTFLIDAQGNIVREWRGVKVPGHAQEVLDAVRAL
ncbi:MAG: peroxiredoxin, partial [Rhodocyclaceae bacterium]|nr:peroxiredoxin [Rhodocyclaceae bacterium]